MWCWTLICLSTSSKPLNENRACLYSVQQVTAWWTASTNRMSYTNVSTSRNIGQHLSINKNWTTLNLYHSLKNTPRQSNRSQQSPRLRLHSKIKRKQQAKKKHFQEALHINHDHTSLNEQRSLPLTKVIEAWRKCKHFKKFLYNQLDSFRSDLIWSFFKWNNFYISKLLLTFFYFFISFCHTNKK